MRAGRLGLSESVRPLSKIDVDNVSDGDEEGDLEVEGAGEGCERLALEKEGGEIRRLIDPLLPSQREVEEPLG